MVSQFDNIKISYLLHIIIYQTEKDLKNISKFPTYLQKVQLVKKLLISRVRFSRFLVVCRWLKYNSYIDKNNSKSNSISFEKSFLEIKKQVKSYKKKTQGNQHDFCNSKQQFMEQYNLNQLTQNFLHKINNRKKIFQHLCSFLDNYKEIPHIQTIYVIKKYIYINAHPYYQLILKIKDQFCTINRLKLKWDKNLHFSSEYLIRIVSHLNQIDMKKPKELNRIDSFIFSFYIIYFFCKIVQKLMKIAKSFNCQILRESNNLVLIIFPKSFQPFNQFILRINSKSNNIEILSKTPLFHPPKDPRTIDEEFGKLDDDIFIPMKIYNCIIDITKKFNGTLFLSELRDLVFYTNVRRFWNFLKREMRSHILPIFKISLKCNFNSIYFISIHFVDKPNRLLTIIFQSKDGFPLFIPISKHFDLGIQPMFPDAKKIFTSIFIYNECQLDFSYMFKSHVLTLMKKFQLINSLDYRINFSFSDNFFIVKRNLILFPSLTLRSIDSPKNLNPRTFLIKQLIKSNKFDQLMTNLTITSKIFLILLEIERKLKFKGILSKRVLNTICIPKMGCIFKIDLNEYWSICFEKPLIHGVSNGQVIITGNKLSLRFVDSIIKIITDWFRFGLLIYIFRHKITYTDDCKMYLKSFEYHFCISYEPYYYDYYLNANITHCFKVLPFRYPSSNMKVMMYTPFSNYAQYLNNEEDISSYFCCSIYYQLKIIEIFNSKKWKVVPFFGEDSFTLIYENHLSMIFHLDHDDFHFIVYIFMIGYSSLLLVPLSNLFQIHENGTPFASIKMTFFDLEKVKHEIEKYDDLIKLFKLMKIDHLFYKKGKVIGKGTRFYLVQAVFDLNGIIISSPSFPSLINITTSFYNLNISLESKKKIYNFILSILLFDEKYIVETLNVLKELIKPQRIHKLNWEEMSNYLKINSTEITLELLIIEDENKLSFIFDDPINESVLVKKNGREKRFNAKEFDNIYLYLNPELLICNQFDF